MAEERGEQEKEKREDPPRSEWRIHKLGKKGKGNISLWAFRHAVVFTVVPDCERQKKKKKIKRKERRAFVISYTEDRLPPAGASS